MLNDIVKNLLSEVAGMIPTTGAFNIRNNGKSEGRSSSENIDIVPKPNGEGIDVYVTLYKKRRCAYPRADHSRRRARRGL